LNYEEAPIINAILRSVADPQTLEALLEWCWWSHGEAVSRFFPKLENPQA
jgi:hypothetical protein